MYVPINENYYWMQQAGSGPPLLLLHGFTGSAQTWNEFMKKWSTYFHVIAIDLPGHGQTKMYTSFSMESVSQDLKEIIQQLGYDSVHILGYSMGGRTALSFTSMYPDNVRSLLMESASPGLKTTEEREARRKKDRELASFIKEKGLKAFVDYWESIPLFKTQSKLSLEIKKRIRQERLLQNSEGLIQSLQGMGTGAQSSFWDKLSSIHHPVLLITGALDKKFVGINKEMKALLPNASLFIVENVGHAVHVELPQYFGKIVSNFIKKHT